MANNVTRSCVHCGLGLVWSDGLRAWSAASYVDALCSVAADSIHVAFSSAV